MCKVFISIIIGKNVFKVKSLFIGTVPIAKNLLFNNCCSFNLDLNLNK